MALLVSYLNPQLTHETIVCVQRGQATLFGGLAYLNSETYLRKNELSVFWPVCGSGWSYKLPSKCYCKYKRTFREITSYHSQLFSLIYKYNNIWFFWHFIRYILYILPGFLIQSTDCINTFVKWLVDNRITLPSTNGNILCKCHLLEEKTPCSYSLYALFFTEVIYDLLLKINN